MTWMNASEEEDAFCKYSAVHSFVYSTMNAYNEQASC